jgi:hypothetical protein
MAVSDRGILITPRWPPLAAAGAPNFKIVWDNVDQIQTLLGPRGSTHGVRLVLRRRGAVNDPGGLARIFGPIARHPTFGLVQSDVEQFLALGPAGITRRDQRGLFWWP